MEDKMKIIAVGTMLVQHKSNLSLSKAFLLTAFLGNKLINKGGI